MKAADYIAQFLDERGIPCVFEMSGGMITMLLDAIHRRGATRIVSVHHEQSAAFAADAVGRLTRKPGVAMATSGPGATNLLTGIGSCYFDSSPALFITGQVNRHELKGDRPIRQLGFQETDIVSMARPITKEAHLVEDPRMLPELLERAYEVSTSGRPGPVLLDVPMDVQRAEVEPAPRSKPSERELPGPAVYAELFAAVRRAERPLVLIGGGIQSSGSAEALRALVSKLGVPVVHSLMAVDVLPYDHPLRVGMIGSYGNRWANHAIACSDLLIVLGSRLDVRQTGSDTSHFKEGRQIFHVDCEPGEINNRVTDCHAIVAELKSFLTGALDQACEREFPGRAVWLSEIARLRAEWPDTAELADTPGINPNAFLRALSGAAGAAKAAAYVTDVGQHQMWAAQSVQTHAHQRFLR